METPTSPQEDGQDIFSHATVEQAARNLSDLVGLGILDDMAPMKLVIEASNQVLNRKYGKPRETIELSHKIKLHIDVPGWGLPAPVPEPLLKEPPVPAEFIPVIENQNGN